MKKFTNLVAGPATIVFRPLFPTVESFLYVGYGFDVTVLKHEADTPQLEAPNQATGIEDIVKKGEKFTLTFIAGEMSLANLRVFWGTTDTVQQTGSPPASGTEEVEFGGNEHPVKGTLYIYGQAPNGKTRRMIMWNAGILGDASDYQFDRSKRTNLQLAFVSIIDDNKEPGHQMLKIEDDYDTAYSIVTGLETS